MRRQRRRELRKRQRERERIKDVSRESVGGEEKRK